jgi:Fe-S cluster biogenesis protein NfuA
MSEVRDRIVAALDEIRPALQFDGGDVELLDWNEATGVVTISMVGACHGCSMSTVTLAAGLDRIVRERVPEVKQVLNRPPEYAPTNPKY